MTYAQDIELMNVCAGYKDKVILHDIQMTVKAGKITALRGRNGSGKSTLLRCITGIQLITSGEICLGALNLQRINTLQRSEIIGALWTERPRIAGISVLELVEMGLFNGAWQHTGKSKSAYLNEILHLFGIGDISSQSTAELSDGQLQKALLARAVAQKPKFLLLDEPTTYLDYVAKDELMATLKSICHKTGVGILLSSHDIPMINQFADIHYELSDTRIHMRT